MYSSRDSATERFFTLTPSGVRPDHAPELENHSAAASGATPVDMWERLRQANVARLDILEETVISLLEGMPADGQLAAAQEAVEALVASIAVYGFEHAARLAREMEQLLRRQPAPHPADILRMSELTVLVRRTLESATPDGMPGGDAGQQGRPSVLVVHTDREVAERLALEAMAWGIRGEAALNLPAARGALRRTRPDLVILDLGLSDALDAAASLLSELRAMVPPVPALVLGTGDTLAERVRIAALGARGYLANPATPSEILATAADLLHQIRAAASRVLIVDDDSQALVSLETALASTGMEVSTLADPARFWEKLEGFVPDLLLLDLDMPGFSGAELCRVVRTDPRWRALPVLFLTSGNDAEAVREVVAARADDYVQKPVIPSELVAQVFNRLERAQLQRRMAETDMLTGVANRRKAGQTFGQLIRVAARSSSPMCLTVLHLDGFREINEEHGHVAGDSVLHALSEYLVSTFRGEDAVARWGGAEFVVGMHGVTGPQAVQRLTRIVDDFRKRTFRGATGDSFQVALSGAIVEYPKDGDDLEDLYRAADEVVHRVKAAGGDQVVLAPWRDGVDANSVRRVDVVVIDHDESVAGVLLHALESRGYRTECFRTGRDADAAMLGAAPTVQSRVVLLDVDLPDMNGYELLQSLTQRGSTRRTRVIVLTARASEPDVLKALELGAFDHVAKPFSVPILTQRIRRALEG